jgi:hypothetical protein
MGTYLIFGRQRIVGQCGSFGKQRIVGQCGSFGRQRIVGQWVNSLIMRRKR